MGFDAIWISPIPKNMVDNYHGYAAIDFTRVNENFGTLQDLHELIDECHRRDIWVMLDIVCNHVACVGDDYDTKYSGVTPFNDGKYYHSLCYITQHDWDTRNQYNIEHCRLSCLADLDQDNQFVREYLKQWVKNQTLDQHFDGYRVDTVPEVAKDFWKDLSDFMGQTYMVGEVLNGDYDYVAGYQD